MLHTARVFVALPSYDGSRFNALPLMALARECPLATPVEMTGSLLCQVFNQLWCMALQAHDAGEATHFLMMHADVVPIGDRWFSTLWDEFQRNEAEMMSAIVPVKSGDGLTSTAFESTDGKRFRRLTTTEALDGPVSFTRPNLLLNTGLMLIDLRAPWTRRVAFSTLDDIIWVNGVPMTSSLGEDWRFTMMARLVGCRHDRIFATRVVPLTHVGSQRFPSTQAWGMPTDDGEG